jgi:hypothetical protein
MILEERILKILRKEIPETLRETGKQRASKEIGTFIKENYVEKEFVRWLYYEAEYKPELHDLSLADIKRYWLTNIKDK